MKIKLEKVRVTAVPFEYKTSGAAGFDIASSETMTVTMNSTRVIPTGWKLEIPEGYEVQIRPRSGLSRDTGLRIPNSPGTIDSDFRGELCILLENTSGEDYTIKKGDRIAQGIFAPAPQCTFEESKLTETERGEGGFGSTGGSGDE